jgi:hypothetical protein
MIFFKRCPKFKKKLVAEMGSKMFKFSVFSKKIQFFLFRNILFEFWTPFFKKSYLSLSTDYTYKFLVNDIKRSEFSPRHLKFIFQRLIKKILMATMHRYWLLALYNCHHVGNFIHFLLLSPLLYVRLLFISLSGPMMWWIWVGEAEKGFKSTESPSKNENKSLKSDIMI